MRRAFIFSLAFLISGILHASKDQFSELRAHEKELLQIQKELFRYRKDFQKDSANKIFLEKMEQALRLENSFHFPFDSLKGIGRLMSPDKKFRIINWNLGYSNGSYKYFGFIQAYNEKTKSCDLFRLTDKSDEIRNPETATGSHDKWYGMLYYEIIPKKTRKKTYYTLLGWDGNNSITSKKIIDVLTFTHDNKPRFGETLFDVQRSPKRIIFEYSSEAVMMMRYDEKTGGIVADNLSPREPALTGQHQFYGPDFTYNSFDFSKGKWVYRENVDVRNPSSSKDKYYLDPKSGKKRPARVLYDTTKHKAQSPPPR